MSRRVRQPDDGPRVITATFALPPTTNQLERMHYRRTTALRTACEAIWRSVKPRGWKALKRFRVEATFHTPNKLCDPLELWYRCKRHVDAATRAGIIEDDGPRNLVPTIPRQVSAPEGRLVITFTELLADG